MKSKSSLLLLSAVALVGMSAHGATITGTAYSAPNLTSSNFPTQGNVPAAGGGTTLLATFNASAINFTGDGPGQYSLGGFLNSFGAASNINYMNGGSAASSLTNTLFEFTGSALFTNGQSYSVYHDDGVRLYVGNQQVLNAPQGTAPVNTPYTFAGTTGVYNFDFLYANGPPTQADFTTPLTLASVSTTPEPSSLLLLGSGLLGTVAAAKRRLKKA